MAYKLGTNTKVGDTFPDVKVDIGFLGLDPSNSKSTAELSKGKTLWVSLPGAFTPTWSTCQVPGLKKAEIQGTLEKAGIDKVYVYCVNDGAVMTGWKKDQGLAGSDLIEFVADTQASLTEALDIVLTGNAGPAGVLGAHTKRCKRTAMYVVDGVIKVIQIAEADDDPAGDAKPDATLIETMLPLIAAV